MQHLKLAALQILMRILVHLHHATFVWLRWCENRLEEFQMLDGIVDEILNQKPSPRRPDAPVLIVRVTRPRMH